MPPLTIHYKEHTDSYVWGSRKVKTHRIYFCGLQNLFDSSTITWALGAANARPGTPPGALGFFQILCDLIGMGTMTKGKRKPGLLNKMHMQHSGNKCSLFILNIFLKSL